MDERPQEKIYEAILGVMRDVGGIEKTKQGQYTSRAIDDVYNKLQPALIKNNVVIIPTVKSNTQSERQSKNGGTLIFTQLMVQYDFICSVDGSKVTALVPGEAMDAGDKSTNKAMSAAYKYAMFQTFAIPVGNIDSEKDTYELGKQKRQEVIPETKLWENAKAAFRRDGNLDAVLKRADMSEENKNRLVDEVNNETI